MKYVWGSLLLIVLILAIDLAHAHIQDWFKERVRQKNIARFAMSQFNGTRKSTWLS